MASRFVVLNRSDVVFQSFAPHTVKGSSIDARKSPADSDLRVLSPRGWDFARSDERCGTLKALAFQISISVLYAAIWFMLSIFVDASMSLIFTWSFLSRDDP